MFTYRKQGRRLPGGCGQKMPGISRRTRAMCGFLRSFEHLHEQPLLGAGAQVLTDEDYAPTSAVAAAHLSALPAAHKSTAK